MKKQHWITRNSKAVSSLLIRWKKELGKRKRCLVCGEDMSITFHKHHINGNHNNNSSDNLVDICASCHAITYKAKNPKEAKKFFKRRHEKWKRRKTGARKAWENKRSSGSKWWDKKHRIRIKR